MFHLTAALFFNLPQFLVMRGFAHKRKTFHVVWSCQTFQMKALFLDPYGWNKSHMKLLPIFSSVVFLLKVT